MECPNFNLIVWKMEGVNRAVMCRLRCKQWSCAVCAAQNRQDWRSHLKKRIGRLGGEWWFVTLTAHAWYREQSTSLENLRRGIDKLLKRIRRIWKGVQYVRAYEAHQNGAFHAHFCMSGLSSFVMVRHRGSILQFNRVHVRGAHKGVWSLQTWFKKTACALKMGYMVDVSPCASVPQVVNYVCKYMTKQAQSFSVRHLRRIQTSQGIGSPYREPEGGWQVGLRVWGSDIGHGKLHDANLKITIQPDYWQEHLCYPDGDDKDITINID